MRADRDSVRKFAKSIFENCDGKSTQKIRMLLKLKQLNTYGFGEAGFLGGLGVNGQGFGAQGCKV